MRTDIWERALVATHAVQVELPPLRVLLLLLCSNSLPALPYSNSSSVYRGGGPLAVEEFTKEGEPGGPLAGEEFPKAGEFCCFIERGTSFLTHGYFDKARFYATHAVQATPVLRVTNRGVLYRKGYFFSYKKEVPLFTKRYFQHLLNN